MKKINITLVFLLVSIVHSDCAGMDYDLCMTYSQYCQWDNDSAECFEEGGGGGNGGGSGNANGPYEFSSISESQGLRNGPDYVDGVVYYPIGGVPPYKSIIFTPGFGGGSIYMSNWAEFFDYHGFLEMRFGQIDVIIDCQ